MDQEQDQNEINESKDHCLFPKFQKNLIEEFISNNIGKDIQTNKGFKDKFNKSLVLFNLYLVHVIKHQHGQKRKKVTEKDILAALKQMQLEEIADQLQENPIPEGIEKEIIID
ncbi:hypothetical protein pb186bvf_006238 [Paramecium bursaria]